MAWEACYSTPLEAEAYLVKGFLEQYGVPCVLENDRFGAQPLTFCALGQVKVLVPMDWLRVARGLIKGREGRCRRAIPRGVHAEVKD
ncbi:MAG: putative prokaryotic signal transducing protein [Deltaproteobacteria bacterium]|jgi:hypothetical protein|nr:putative prokaryotic signal transducing protein [Deltaproteobacteria bacterium]